MKVISIAHGAGIFPSNRARYEAFSESYPDIENILITPVRWREFGREIALQYPRISGVRPEHVRFNSLPGVQWYLHHYPRLRSLLTKYQPDVIHLWEEPWSVVAWQAGRIRDRLLPDAALVLETEQNVLRKLPPPFESIRTKTLRQTDLLIGRQTESLDVARACGYEGPTSVVEYGFDSKIFEPQPRGPAREALKLSGFVVGYVGRIVHEKGLHDVLEAMQASDSSITLCILGDGPDKDALMRRARQIGVQDRVRLLGSRPPSEVARFMNALDVLVLMSRTTPTWKEQFGRVIIEAHACGTPVIGSNSGAIPSVVGNAGWIIPEGDIEALAALLRRLVLDRSQVAKAGDAGLAQVRDRFSIATIVGDLEDAFIRAKHARLERRGRAA